MGRVRQRWLPRSGAIEWRRWPQRAYETPTYRQRLLGVQKHLSTAIDLVDGEAVRVVSICAGDGRDVIDVMASHPRGGRVAAVLVELNRRSVAAGRKRAAAAGLADDVTYVAGDATDFGVYRDHVPCDIVLVCGVWGHVPPQERGNLVNGLRSMLRPGGFVVWTRGAGTDMSRVREIGAHFAAPEWNEREMTVTADDQWAVVTEQYGGATHPLPTNERMFHFTPNAG